MSALQPSNPVLVVASLQTEFRIARGKVQAVRDVSFTLEQGERLGIVGESGCGKSAMALSIMGLIEPPGFIVAGSVKLVGQELVGLPDRRLRKIRGREISLIYQDASAALDPVRSIGAHLLEAIRNHDATIGRAAARRRAVELLRDVEVPNAERRLNDYPHQYSGGMRQRVVIACALAHEPTVVIADEPTTALDVTTQAQVLTLLGRLVEERRTAVVLITHNLGIVAEFCDTVRVMYAGRFVEQASTETLFTTPRHPYTSALLGSVPRVKQLLTGPLPAIGGSPPDLASVGPGCAFAPRCLRSRGREICQTTAPAAPLRTDGHIVECHFADEDDAILADETQ